MKQTLLLFFGLLFGLHAYAADGDVFTAKTVKSAVENTEKEEFFIIASDSTLETESGLTKNVGSLNSKSGTYTYIDGNASSITQTYYYMEVWASSANSHPSIAFKMPNGTKGKYEIYLVTVPLWMRQFNFETEKRPYRFNADIYEKENNSYHPSHGVRLVNPVDSTFIFTTPIPSNEFTISDTTYLGEYMFNGNDAAIQISSNFASKMKEYYSRNLLITGFILKESIAPNTEIIEKDNIRYLLNDELNLALVRKNNYQGDIEIPTSIDYMGKEYTVNSIGPRAFSGCSGLTSIEIPNSVTSIGWEAFQDCSGLDSITIPYSVKKIDGWAFLGCKRLLSINISDNTKDIGYQAFHGTAWYDSQPEGVVYLRHIVYGYKGEMPENTHLVLKESSKCITASAFGAIEGLASITIPKSVTYIGGSALYNCRNLKIVSFEDGLDTLFFNQYVLSSSPIDSVYLGRNISYEHGFADDSKSPFYNIPLKSIAVGSSVQSFGPGSAFYGTKLQAVHISDLAAWCNVSCVQSGSNPLYYAKHLYLKGEEVKNLVVPDGVTNIGRYAFVNCSGLTSVELPSSVSCIESGAFMGCSNLTSIEIPNSVDSIGDYAFDFCI